MQRLLSTYLFVSRKLTPELLGQISDAKFQGVEIFCARSHFEYAAKAEVQAMAGALEANNLKLVSLHGPTSRDLSAVRAVDSAHGRLAGNRRSAEARCGFQYARTSGPARAPRGHNDLRGKHQQRNGRPRLSSRFCGRNAADGPALQF